MHVDADGTEVNLSYTTHSLKYGIRTVLIFMFDPRLARLFPIQRKAGALASPHKLRLKVSSFANAREEELPLAADPAWLRRAASGRLHDTAILRM